MHLLVTIAMVVTALVQAAPNRVIGYHESWGFYGSGNKPYQYTPDILSRYTHINYAFASIAHHTATGQYYVAFTDPWADYQACVGTNCPSECFVVPATQQCTGGKISMVPFIGANGTCPDSDCYNPSGASIRNPQCEAVLAPNVFDWSSTPPTPYLCGNYAYILNKVKKQGPGLKYLISIGGWYDSNLFSIATEPANIDKFVQSIVQFVKFFGFDGVDFDWEYPGWEHGSQPVTRGGADGAGNSDGMTDCSKTTCAYPARTNDMAKFNALVTKTRAALKALGKTKFGNDYLISMAAPAGYDKMNKLDIKTVCSQLDYINIMTYDIHGEWESNTNHQAPLYDNTPKQFLDPNGIPQTSVDYAVNYWIKNGCPANQVVVGVPFYAHAWKAADGGSKGLFQPGTASTLTNLNYVDISADTTIANYWDATAQASYGYSAAKGIFYSYDTPQALAAKVGYGTQKGLGGFMVWPVAGDDANGTLLKALTGAGTLPPPPPVSSSTAAPKTTSTAATTTISIPTTISAKPSTTTVATTNAPPKPTTTIATTTTLVKPTTTNKPTTTATTVPKPIPSSTKNTTAKTTTTKSNTSPVKTTASASGGNGVLTNTPCTKANDSKCSNGTMYYCYGTTPPIWKVWYVGC
ncbi:UNVERIFIED_CONTAM: hypothetical protein HDU68_011470 [Siphonaria sp. JEL0065]|nr:hypothetical protein HDU68_011470 [Siphonaria sp. JEL0065]